MGGDIKVCCEGTYNSGFVEKFGSYFSMPIILRSFSKSFQEKEKTLGYSLRKISSQTLWTPSMDFLTSESKSTFIAG
ncbi:hypothetical protein VNO77_01242 [Canavalia gladiata]|uniref:Uncharacterized protein n=1 Tax=Canavalia gladiata TaxID=3824 RepID=A0AAN9MVI9_CANGL